MKRPEDYSYSIDHFITKFEAIPEEFWSDHALIGGSRRCAQGHCLELPFELGALRELFRGRVSRINNGEDPGYPQSTPKLRILAALKDLKEGKF